jgi:hypothetical protein
MFRLVDQSKNINKPIYQDAYTSIKIYFILFPIKEFRLESTNSNNMCYESNNPVVGISLSGRGNHLSIGGINLPAGGNDLSIRGNNNSVRGNNLSVGGINLPIGGNDLSVRGNLLSIAGKELLSTRYMYCTSIINIVFNY